MRDETIEPSATEAASAALQGVADALSDARVRANILRAEIERGTICSASAVDAVQGIDRQADRITELSAQLRRAMTRHARGF